MSLKKLNTPPKPSPNDGEWVAPTNEVVEPEIPEVMEGELDLEGLDDKPSLPKKKKKTKEFYVDEKEFETELRDYYTSNVISIKLADMIRKMINGLAHRPNFINYTFRDEATGDALVNIMAALHKKKFRFEKNKKPFSYFNAIAWNCWRNRIKREARARNALAAYQDEVYSETLAQGIRQED